MVAFFYFVIGVGFLILLAVGATGCSEGTARPTFESVREASCSVGCSVCRAVESVCSCDVSRETSGGEAPSDSP